MKDLNVYELSDVIRETGFDVHRYLLCGHLEPVYEASLYHRLRKRGLDVDKQIPLAVYDADGIILGEYYADLLIENKIIVEIKASRCLSRHHISQFLGCLRASRKSHGMLINFGSPTLQIRKFFLGFINE